MYKLILLQEEKLRKNNILEDFFQTLSPLVNIKGLIAEKTNNKGIFKFNLLSQPSLTFEVDISIGPKGVRNAVELHIEQIITELSVFEFVDVFLIDCLGLLEMHVPRLKQQIITVFSSRIPVIATLCQFNKNALTYILDYFPVKIMKTDGIDQQELFFKIIKELYDL